MNDGETQKMVDAIADAARTGMGEMSRAQLDQGWERLEHALTESRYPRVPIIPVRRRRWLRGLALGAAAAVAVLAFDQLRGGRAGSPLQYVVEGAVVGPGETIGTDGATTGQLVFSDDSRIRMVPSTKLRVLGRDANGTRIALRDGELDVEVRHRASTSWRFDAGPFTVKVVGTSFRLGFDERRGRFTLHVSSGVVKAWGPSRDRAFTLRAGESLELFDEATGKPSATAAPVSAEASTPASAQARASQGVPAAAEPIASRPSSAAARRRLARVDRTEAGFKTGRWGRLIGQGEFAAVVREAERQGLDVVLANVPAADLTALADAARYLRRNDLARQALFGLRARFPGTARASDAAFFLGRLAEHLPSSTSAAIAWYETYLTEAARGPYAGEALGREITLLARTDRARARQVARNYLERFPGGTQAELARSLLGQP
jgi:transmembrane sensor